MSKSLTRRAFLGTSTAAGVVLAGQLHRTTAMAAEGAEGKAWPPGLPAVKIHKVFVGRTGGIYLSRPKAEIEKFNTYLGQLEGKLNV